MAALDELRAAAAKIRARAEDATEGPWKADHREYPETIYGTDAGGLNTYVVAGSRWGGEANVFDNNDDAYHIALWHPGNALLVAELLDFGASITSTYEIGDAELDTTPWLKVARAINATEVA